MLKILVMVFSLAVLSTASGDYKTNQELHNAIRNSNMDMLKYFLKTSVNSINEKDDFGYTPIHLAVRKNDIEVVKLILEYKPQLDTQDKFGDTPLIDAARNNNMEIVKLLICKNANKNLTNNENKNALDFISKYKQYETALFVENPKCVQDNNKQEKENLIKELRKLK